MQQSILTRAVCLVMVGFAGCSGADFAKEEVGASEEGLGTCASQNLAISAATASTIQQNHFVPAWAIDGNLTTRWSSTQGAPQWLRLDLGQRRFISSVTIDWETAFSPNYEIQVSDNGVNFAPIRKIVSASGGHQLITGLDVDARYVRIYANQVSGYGNVSIFEVSVSGANDPACSSTPVACGDSVRLPPTASQSSSQEFTYTPASAGADDVYSTRWSSNWADNQWLALDLGAAARIDKLRIAWQSAYASSYAIETASSFSGPWMQAKLVTNGHGGVETVTLGSCVSRASRAPPATAFRSGISLFSAARIRAAPTICSPAAGIRRTCWTWPARAALAAAPPTRSMPHNRT
jgi:hypothetical protein